MKFCDYPWAEKESAVESVREEAGGRALSTIR